MVDGWVGGWVYGDWRKKGIHWIDELVKGVEQWVGRQKEGWQVGEWRDGCIDGWVD